MRSWLRGHWRNLGGVLAVLVIAFGFRLQNDQNHKIAVEAVEIHQQAEQLKALTLQRSGDRTSQIKFVCNGLNTLNANIVAALRAVEPAESPAGADEIEALIRQFFKPLDCSKITTPK